MKKQLVKSLVAAASVAALSLGMIPGGGMAERLGIVTESKASEDNLYEEMISCQSDDDIKKLINKYDIPEWNDENSAVIAAAFRKAAANNKLSSLEMMDNGEVQDRQGTAYVLGYQYYEDPEKVYNLKIGYVKDTEAQIFDYEVMYWYCPLDQEEYIFVPWESQITYKLFKADSEAPTVYLSPQVASSYAHEHTYDWKVLTDPTIDQDGVYAYMCSCGDIKEKQPISAAQVFVKGLYGKVKEASQNGTVTYDAKSWSTISDYVLKKMAERNDVAVTIQFNYQKTAYEITFPAGTDYTTVLNDTETMYGFFGIAKILGLNVKAI